MSVLIRRYLHPKPPFTHIRQGHPGPSRVRLKRKNQKEVRDSNDNPYIFHPRVRTIEPVKQAIRNTKSIMNAGLPAVVLSRMNDVPFEYILPQIRNSLFSALSCADSLNVKHVRHRKGDVMNVIKAVWSCADRYDGYDFTHRHTAGKGAGYKIYLKYPTARIWPCSEFPAKR